MTNSSPKAKKIPHEVTLHGDTRIDNYHWMRNKQDPEVISYLEAENAFTQSYMNDTKDLQETIFKEMVGRIQETDTSSPYTLGDYQYYSHTFAGKQYTQNCRKKLVPGAQEEILLDLNEMAKGVEYLSLGTFEVSPNDNLLAYSLDKNGYETYDLFVKDLSTGNNIACEIHDVVSLEWANDNKTFFYTTSDETKRSYRVYKHVLGESDPTGKNDTLIYEEKDIEFSVYIGKSKSQKYLFLNCSSGISKEYHFLDANHPNQDFQILEPRRKDHEYYIEHHEDSFYILTNTNGKEKAVNFRLVKTPVQKTGESHWQEVVAHDDDITLENFDVFKNFFVLTKRVSGLKQLHVLNFTNQEWHVVEQPEDTYSAEAALNFVYDSETLRYYYTSFTTPSTAIDYNMLTKEKTVIKVQPVLGNYHAEDYQSERVWAESHDGTLVPISLVYKKDLKKEDAQPLYLIGYGSYGMDYDVYFSSARLSLLDRGVIFAIAHIRGGGDLGEKWRNAGKMLKKKNTFFDFIACAKHLINKNYTASEQLVIQGGSAGGLLMGAVLNLEPTLFKAAIASVPFVDCLNTMLDASLPLTTGEYVEWGNPNEKIYYDYMKSYCPYTNVSAKAYPSILINSGLNDPRVHYWEGAKWAAKLKEFSTSGNPILLKTNMGAGHGGSSGRYDKLKEVAFDFAFVLKMVTGL